MAVKVSPGMVFGDLEVLSRVEGTSNGSRWKCKCHRCGSECIARGTDLTAGVRKDCGCDLRDRMIMPGKQFGGLVVLRKAEKPFWIVRCLKCGQEKKMRQSSICRKPNSCGCWKDLELYRENGKKAIEKNMIPGVDGIGSIQRYTATKETPNNGNTTGYRWVHVLRRKGREWIFASFIIGGKRYYRGGFSSTALAYEWAQSEHKKLLDELGITDPRKEN